jgi:hypothetical protein
LKSAETEQDAEKHLKNNQPPMNTDKRRWQLIGVHLR